MASPYDLEFGKVIELYRVLTSAGFDKETMLRVKDNPDLAKRMLESLKEPTVRPATEVPVSVVPDRRIEAETNAPRFDCQATVLDETAWKQISAGDRIYHLPRTCICDRSTWLQVIKVGDSGQVVFSYPGLADRPQTKNGWPCGTPVVWVWQEGGPCAVGRKPDFGLDARWLVLVKREQVASFDRLLSLGADIDVLRAVQSARKTAAASRDTEPVESTSIEAASAATQPDPVRPAPQAEPTAPTAPISQSAKKAKKPRR